MRISFPPPAQVERTRVASATALLGLLADGVSSLADEDLVALAKGAEALGRRIDALRTRIAGEIDARSDREESGREGEDRLSERYGCRNGIEVLERLTRASAKTLRQRVRLDRSTRATSTLTGLTRPARFPEVSAAFRAGELGFDAACYITDEFARLERHGGASHDEVDVAEREIVESVAPNSGTSTGAEVDVAPSETVLPRTYDELQIVVDTWTAFLGRNGVEPDAEQAERFRGVSLGRMRDGLVPLHGSLVPEAAAGLQLLFDAHNGSPTRFRPSSPEAGDDGADPERYLHDPRTAPQRRHDVMVSMIQTAAASSDAPSLGGSAPTLVVTATVDDLDHGTARIERTHATVPSSLAHRIACTGGVQKVVFGTNGRIVSLGTPERLFNAHQRRAISARDGGCIIPGCTIPAAWCEIHHVTEHSRGGPTHTDNGVLLCWAHHHGLDRSGWQIMMRGGVPHVKAPGWYDPRGAFRPVGNRRTERDRIQRLSRFESPPLKVPAPAE